MSKFDIVELENLVGKAEAEEIQSKIDKFLGREKDAQNIFDIIMDVANAANFLGYMQGQETEAYSNAVNEQY